MLLEDKKKIATANYKSFLTALHDADEETQQFFDDLHWDGLRVGFMLSAGFSPIEAYEAECKDFLFDLEALYGK